MSVSRFWRDVRWQVAGNGTAQLIGIAALPLVTRLYTPEDMAAQAVFLQFAMFFTGVMTLRFEYFVQLPKDDDDAVDLIRLCVVLALATLALYTPAMAAVAALWDRHDPPTSTDWLWLSPASAALISVSLAWQHYVQRHGDFKASGLGEIAAKLGFFGAALLGAGLALGSFGLLMTTAAGCAAKLVYLYCFGLKPRLGQLCPPSPATLQRLKKVAKVHWHQSMAMVAALLTGTVTGLTPILFMAAHYAAHDLGQFNLVSLTIFLPASLIGNAIGQVFYQQAARHWAGGNGFAQLFTATTRKLIIIGLPLYGGIALLSPWAYGAIFGSAWVPAGNVAQWMAIPAACAFISTPMERACLITGRWRYQIAWHSARAITTVLMVSLAWYGGWTFNTFIMALAMQMSALYLFDLGMEYRFSKLRPPPPPVAT